MAGTPRSRMDGDGTMRWRCSQCTVYRPESEMEWGLGGHEEWPPWRVVCKRCSVALPKLSPPPAAKDSAQGCPLSPRRTLSPRRLVPLAPARADLNARSACNRAAGCGGSLAAASILRPPAPRRSRDPKRHALVSRFRDDRPKPRAAPGVNSRLRALSSIQQSKRCHSDADEEEDEPPPGGYDPRVFFEPKLERSMLRDLLSQTTMSRAELYRLFNRFKALCQVLVRVRARARARARVGVRVRVTVGVGVGVGVEVGGRASARVRVKALCQVCCLHSRRHSPTRPVLAYPPHSHPTAPYLGPLPWPLPLHPAPC